MLFAAVLFDLDGTLVDTAPDLIAALQQTLKLADLSCHDDQATMRTWVSHGGRYMLQQALVTTETDPRLDILLQQFIDIYKAHISQYSQLFAGFGQILQGLEQQAIPWGIVTNKSTELTMPLLQDLQLDKRAAVVVCGDTLAYKKPDPEPMYYACQQMQIAADNCLYIGDAERDIRAGRNAAMTTAVALFGYISSTDKPNSWGADYLLNDATDLNNLLFNN